MMESREEILEEAGRELRGARRARGWTLRDVGTRSDGQFKPTAVAGYERGERGISLERFCSLAQLYGMHPERLLSRIMWRIGGGPEPKIDRSRLAQLPEEEAGTVGEFIDEVRRLRGDVDDETITIRIQDLEVLATVSGRQLDQFLDHLGPALAVGGDDKPRPQLRPGTGRLRLEDGQRMPQRAAGTKDVGDRPSDGKTTESGGPGPTGRRPADGSSSILRA